MIIIYNLILILFFIITFPGSYFILLYYLKKTKYEFPNKKYFYWIHCASLGEVKIALRLIDNISLRTKISKEKILLTITNPKTKMIAKKQHNDVYIFPIDFFLITRKFLNIVNPKVLLIIETDLWPNYIYFSKKIGTKIFLLNGRMSRRTLILLKMFKVLFNVGLSNIDYITVREEIDLRRFAKIYPKNRIMITGNMKYDDIENFNFDFKKENLRFNKNDFILTFGSIRDGEESFVLETINNLQNKNIKFIIAPRHLKNIQKIAEMLNKDKIKFVKRTELVHSKDNGEDVECILVDTLGELKKFYFISDIIFVGGTILPYGGQSIIEPASLGKVVIFGPYIENFFEISKLLKKHNACYSIKTVGELVDIVLSLQKDEYKRNIIGNNAKEVVEKLKGATQKNVDFVLNNL
ncbi:MAG: glycosyltransferase N-terminal domain-containing protein [Endomicrobiia bacterium]